MAGRHGKPLTRRHSRVNWGYPPLIFGAWCRLSLRTKLDRATRLECLRAQATLAQLDRALPSEGRGRRFDSCVSR
jgi:hypothetical protein